MNANSAQARADQTRLLFNWGYSNFEEATPAQAGATLATAKVLYGVAPDVAAGVAQSWTLVIPKGQGAAIKTSISLTPGLEAPISEGAVIGKVIGLCYDRFGDFDGPGPPGPGDFVEPSPSTTVVFSLSIVTRLARP